MKIQSAKAKGRNLQKTVAHAILNMFRFKGLTEKDVRSCPMGSQGADVQLSEAAFKLFPYAIECKSRKEFKTLYGMYDQAAQYDGEPLLIVRGDRRLPLVIVGINHFFDLVEQANG